LAAPGDPVRTVRPRRCRRVPAIAAERSAELNAWYVRDDDSRAGVTLPSATPPHATIRPLRARLYFALIPGFTVLRRRGPTSTTTTLLRSRLIATPRKLGTRWYAHRQAPDRLPDQAYEVEHVGPATPVTSTAERTPGPGQ
jgi:hypothetical protein